MSDTRKAIITTVQVQAAVNSMETLKAEITGTPAVGLLFDKGARGKGFALYTPDDKVVETFDSKEDAFNKFNTWVEVATEVWEAVKAKPVAARGTRKLVEAADKPAA